MLVSRHAPAMDRPYGTIAIQKAAANPWSRGNALARPSCAGRGKQPRDLLGVHVFLNGGVARRAEALEDKEDLVALDQLARLLDRFGRTIGVVIRDEAILRPLMTPSAFSLLK